MRMSRFSSGNQAGLIEYFRTETVAQITASLIGVNASTAADDVLRLRVVMSQAFSETRSCKGAIEVDELALKGIERASMDVEWQAKCRYWHSETVKAHPYPIASQYESQYAPGYHKSSYCSG